MTDETAVEFDLDSVLKRMKYTLPEYSYERSYSRDDRGKASEALRELHKYVADARIANMRAAEYKELAMEQVRAVARLELEVQRLQARAEIVGDELEPMEP